MNIHKEVRQSTSDNSLFENITQMWLEILAGLSHDMRTPLSSIKGYATTLLREDVSWDVETQREFLKIIIEETDFLESLISKLLESTTLSLKGEIELNKKPISLPQMIKRILNDAIYQNKQHTFHVLIPEPFPLVNADALLIERVLRNLIENAVKYSMANTLLVIKGEITFDEVIISIADQGIGIDEEHLNMLFEKFFRVNNGTDEQNKGLGLGLPMARQIIISHGGRIWAKSKPNEGAIFYFSLPY